MAVEPRLLSCDSLNIMNFPPPPPGMSNSSVLDRVKEFLPQIRKANEDLEDLIRREGANAVRIDGNLFNNTDEDEHATGPKENNEKLIGELGSTSPSQSSSISSSLPSSSTVFAKTNNQVRNPKIQVIGEDQLNVEGGNKEDNNLSSQSLQGEECNDHEGDDEDAESMENERKEVGMIQLEFALGDFDNTFIAKAEEEGEKDENDLKDGVCNDDDADMDDDNDEA